MAKSKKHKPHDKAHPLHTNVVFRINPPFKGRFNDEVATAWVREYLTTGTLPQGVEIAAIKWRNAKGDERPWKEGPPETVLKESSNQFRKFMMRNKIHVSRVE